MTLKIEWIDRGREPQCPPNPAFPTGQDVDLGHGVLSCRADLPYPAKRCGLYIVRCSLCEASVALTTAGRPDDPRSISIPCKMKDTKQ